jgi:carboxyl-terminal processing protease
MVQSNDLTCSIIPVKQAHMQLQPSEKSSGVGRSILTGAVIGLLLALVFFAGFFVRDLIESPRRTAAHDYALLAEVQDILDRRYLRPQPDVTVREYAAIRGLLASLEDRYTFFIDPPVAASESDVLAGTYGGIGVQISRAANGEFVLFPFADSPALSAGIRNGDVLLAVNDTPVTPDQPPDAVDQLLRGEVKEGSGVSVRVRQITSDEFEVFIPFGVINVPSVIWRVLTEDETLGYVQILRFTARTPDELDEAVAALDAENIRAMVLDLRGNTGGLLQESIDVADAFLSSGVIVTQRDPDGVTPFNAAAEGETIDLPLVVLVNEMTASGAEVVVGALRDQGRAIAIGRRTFGKGTVQQIYPLSDGSSLHVTSAEWLTPSEQPLDLVGIEPDILVPASTDGRDLDLMTAIEYFGAQPQSVCAECSTESEQQ